jgi:hypothetical protein
MVGNKLCAPEHAPVETLDRMLSHLSELDMFPHGMDHTSPIPFYVTWFGHRAHLGETGTGSNLGVPDFVVVGFSLIYSKLRVENTLEM